MKFIKSLLTLIVGVITFITSNFIIYLIYEKIFDARYIDGKLPILFSIIFFYLALVLMKWLSIRWELKLHKIIISFFVIYIVFIIYNFLLSLINGTELSILYNILFLMLIPYIGISIFIYESFREERK